MNLEEFRQKGHELVDWMADYFSNTEEFPVKSQVKPKDIINQIPLNPPEEGEQFENIFDDFNQIIMPGITHWQHPSYFAYFNANNSYPSVLAEMLTATLGTQCMIWQTSPAAAELEERVMEWTAKIIGLPDTQPPRFRPLPVTLDRRMLPGIANLGRCGTISGHSGTEWKERICHGSFPDIGGTSLGTYPSGCHRIRLERNQRSTVFTGMCGCPAHLQKPAK